MTSLIELFQQHQGKVSDKWHSYLVNYEKLLAKFRLRPVNILEIGIQNGGSLEVWSKYFPNAVQIVGVDINPDCEKLAFRDSRISVVAGDANSNDVERRILECCGEFDVIIDDGSHTSADIIESFSRYFPHLAIGGLYLAEDIHCSYWQSFEGGLHYPYSSMAFFKRLSDVINREHWGVSIDRVDCLSGFERHYNVRFDESQLANIHSVQFFNSICAIEKDVEGANSLGPRCVSGVTEMVVPGHSPLAGECLHAPSQTDLWAQLGQAPENVWVRLNNELAELKSALAEREAELAVITSSNSWRITGPLRYVADSIKSRLHSLGPIKDLLKRRGLISLIRTGVQVFMSGGCSALIHKIRVKFVAALTYREWVINFDTLDDVAICRWEAKVESFRDSPLISLVMPTYNSNIEWLRQAIESVRNQIYTNWELCIADDASPDPEVARLLEHFSKLDSRIKVTIRNQNGGISAASNSALDIASGEWVALLDHDDLLREHALAEVVSAINRHLGCALIYSDEDKLDVSGNRYDPYFKCDWNRALFYSQNFICHLGVYRKDIIDQIEGFRVGYEGAQDYDLALRFVARIDDSQIIHIPKILYHWRAHPESTAQDTDVKPYSLENRAKALRDHLSQIQRPGIVECMESDHLRVRYELPEPLPLVSIIIPTKNQRLLLEQCVSSILELSTYKNFEIIIVDNGSDEVDTIDYLDSFRDSKVVKVLRDDRAFNFSALNNAAVEAANGDYVCLVNNDIEVITPDWLDEMISHAAQADIGAVGACLWYPDNTLQHGGVILGIGGVAGHAHKGLPRGASGYFSRAVCIQELSAVTAACLLVDKNIYKEVSGLDEENLTVAFNDIDFCLKVRTAGYKIVWTPFAELYHHESASRGLEDSLGKIKRFNDEVRYMKGKWGSLLVRDPAYNANLTLDDEDFGLAFPPRVVVET